MKDKANGIKSYLKTNGLQLTLQGLAFVIIVLNLWLASKLAPLTQDLAILAEKVQAQEEVDKNFVPRNEIELQLKDISRRLANIEKSLGISF